MKYNLLCIPSLLFLYEKAWFRETCNGDNSLQISLMEFWCILYGALRIYLHKRRHHEKTYERIHGKQFLQKQCPWGNMSAFFEVDLSVYFLLVAHSSEDRLTMPGYGNILRQVIQANHTTIGYRALYRQ